jgi:hypothetical protein
MTAAALSLPSLSIGVADCDLLSHLMNDRGTAANGDIELTL